MSFLSTTRGQAPVQTVRKTVKRDAEGLIQEIIEETMPAGFVASRSPAPVPEAVPPAPEVAGDIPADGPERVTDATGVSIAAVHEAGHALAAHLFGGEAVSLTILNDEEGRTISRAVRIDEAQPDPTGQWRDRDNGARLIMALAGLAAARFLKDALAPAGKDQRDAREYAERLAVSFDRSVDDVMEAGEEAAVQLVLEHQETLVRLARRIDPGRGWARYARDELRTMIEDALAGRESRPPTADPRPRVPATPRISGSPLAPPLAFLARVVMAPPLLTPSGGIVEHRGGKATLRPYRFDPATRTLS